MKGFCMSTPCIRNLFSLFFIAVISISQTATAQDNSVTIGGTEIKSDAVLYLIANGDQGLILPAVDNVNAFAPSEPGMVAFNRADNRVYYFDGSAWVGVGGGSSGGGDAYSLRLQGANLELLINGGVQDQISLVDFTVGGDLTGNIQAASVVALNGESLPGGSPATNQILVYDGANWTYQPLPAGTFTGVVSDATLTGTGVSGDPLSVDETQLDGSQIAGLPDNSATNELQDIAGVLTQGNNTSGATITGLPTPSGASDAATKAYVDANVGGVQDLQDVLTQGNDAGGVVITNLGTPSNPSEAATKQYVDTQVGGVGLQDLSISGNDLSLSLDPTPAPIDLSVYLDNTDAQNLSLAGATGSATTGETFNLDISGGTGITIQEGTNIAITRSGSNLTIGSTAAASGEANTASNVGAAGTGVFKQKTAADLEFKNINAGSNLISITDDTGNDEIDIDVNQGNLSIANSQVTGLGTLSTLNAISSTQITDGTITGADISSSADITANSFTGDGSALSNINASQLQGTNISGTITPSLDDVLKWDGSQWTAQPDVTTGTPNTFAGAGNPGIVPDPVTETGRFLSDDGTWATPPGGGDLLSTNNLSDVADVTTARSNLGLGSLSTLSTVTSSEITDGTITGADISTGADITANSFTGDGSGLTGITSTVQSDGVTVLGDGTGGDQLRVGAIGSAQITDGSITSADIANSTIQNADIAPAAGINVSKLSGLVDNDASNEIQDLSQVLTQGNSAGNTAIIDVSDPTNPQDAATKAYVDANAGAGDMSTATYDTNTDNIVDNSELLAGQLPAFYLDNTDAQDLANVLTVNNDAGGADIVNLADPINPQDAATKAYVDTNGGATDLSGLSDASVSTPASGDLLIYNGTGTQFQNTPITGDISLVESGATSITTAAGDNIVSAINDAATTQAVNINRINPPGGADKGFLTTDGTNNTWLTTASPNRVFGTDQVNALTARTVALSTSAAVDNIGVRATGTASDANLVSEAAVREAIDAVIGGWGLTGNAGTVDGTNFIGTTDNIPLTFRVGNVQSGRIEFNNLNANTFFGYSSGSSNSGDFNTGIGWSALQANTGHSNTAVGSYSLLNNGSGFANTVVGRDAMRFNTDGAANTAIGVTSLYQNTSGNSNTAIGGSAMNSNTTGFENVAVGNQALQNNTIGNNNTAVGFYALISNTANNNVALGHRALSENTTGTGNTGIGYFAGYTTTFSNANTTGSDNTFIGYNSGPGTTTQYTNATAIGANARVNQSNSLILGNNAFVGIGTSTPASLLTVGSGEEFRVDNAGNLVRIKDVVYDWPVANGSGVLTNDGTGTLSWDAGGGSSLISNAGTNNIFVGEFAGDNNTAINQTFVGYQAGQNVTSGAENTFIGRGAGRFATTAPFNVFVGKDAGLNIVDGDLNTFVGYQAGYLATTGSANTFIGRSAGENNEGARNVLVGENTGRNTTTSNNLTFLGRATGLTNISGNNIVLIGADADVAIDGLSNAIAIGNNATVGASNSMVLGNNVNVGIGTSTPSSLLTVGSGEEYQVDAFGNLIRINDVAYNWPASNGSGVLTNDGTGTLSWGAGGGSLWTDSSPDVYFTGGNVGIGTNSPTAGSLVTISDNDNTAMFVQNNFAASTGDKYGVRSSITGTGTGRAYGNFSYVAPASSGNAYGYYSSVENDGGTGNQYLFFGQNESQGPALNYGIYADNVTENYLDGRLGLGIQQPQQALHVSTTGDAVALFNNTTIGQTINDGVMIGYIGGTAVFHNYEATDINFSTNATNRMNIDGTTGNIGMGISGDSFRKLYVLGGSTEQYAMTARTNYTGASDMQGVNIIVSNSGTGAKYGASAQVLGGSTTSDIYGYYANMAPGTGTAYGFYSTGEESNYFSGEVGIGETNPIAKLQVEETGTSYVARFHGGTGSGADGITVRAGANTPTNGTFFVLFQGGASFISQGSIRASGAGGVQYNTTSDRRLKQNIEDLNSALEKVMQIRPRTYEFKAAPGNKEDGFIAQELKMIYPTVVSGEEDGNVNDEPMMVDYSKLTPLLTKAIQEQQEIIEEQKKEIQSLKVLVSKMETNDASTQAQLDLMKAQLEKLTQILTAEANKGNE